jgi:hypothetical protein
LLGLSCGGGSRLLELKVNALSLRENTAGNQEDRFRQRMEGFLLPIASEFLHAQESNAVPAAWPASRVK